MVTRWTLADGLPSDTLNNVLQTEDGHLWLASFRGLARFDGHSFTVFDRRSVPVFDTSAFYELTEASDGTLWIGLQEGGIAFHREGRFHRLPAEEPFRHTVSRILLDGEGGLWVGTGGHGVFRYREGRFFPMEHPSLDRASIRDMLRDREGSLWFGTAGQGLTHFREGVYRTYSRKDGLASDGVNGLLEVEDGSLWIATMEGLNRLQAGVITSQPELDGVVVNQVVLDSYGNLWLATLQGLWRRNARSGEFESLEHAQGRPLRSLTQIEFDREGALWIASYSEGLIQLQESKFQNYGPRDGLSTYRINVVDEVEEGRYLVGTDDGTVNRITLDANLREQISVLELETPLPDTRVRDFLEDSAGRLWIASYSGLVRVAGGEETMLTTEDGLPTSQFRALHEDRQGRVWIGTADRGVLRTDGGGAYEHIDQDAGLASNHVLSIGEDSEGNVLVGTKEGLSSIGPDDEIVSYGLDDGLAGSFVFSVVTEEDGATWLATNGGLSRLLRGRMTSLTSDHGLPLDAVYDYREDGLGSSWLASSIGVIQIAEEEVEQLMDGEIDRVEAVVYDDRDGMGHRECTGAVRFLQASDGRLWFPTLGGISILDPRRLATNPVAPPVVIHRFAVDGETLYSSGGASGESQIEVPPNPRVCSFDFAALSLRAPSKVRVQYRLLGFDPDWIVAGSSRRVRYTNLPAGDYAFEVIAANNDGVWNREGARVRFRVVPGIYSNPFFLIPSAMVLGLLLAGGWRAWRRSVRATAAAIHRELEGLTSTEIPTFVAQRINPLKPAQARAVLERLAYRLDRSRGAPSLHGRVIHGLAMLFARIEDTIRTHDASIRRNLANALDHQASLWESFVAELEPGNCDRLEFLHGIIGHDRLIAGLLRAEGPGHLVPLREGIGQAARGETSIPLENRNFFPEIEAILEILEQVSGLPGSEDRTLFLARALTRTLGLQEQLLEQEKERPTLDLAVKNLAVESLRHLLSNALQNIHQQAQLEIELHTRVLPAQREAVVLLTVRNVGQGHAHNIRVDLLPSEESFHALGSHQEVRKLLRQQAVRLEFPIAPRVSDTVRVTFVLTYDDLERQGNRREFADSLELRQVQSQRAFQPLRPNPYVVGRPLLESDVFIGREEIFARLETNLRGAHQDNVVVLMGPRRMGKTSILRRLHGYLGEHYATVVVDLQGMIGSGQGAFFQELVAAITDELEEQGLEVEEPTSEDLLHDPGSVFRQRFLRNVTRSLGDRRLLLIFDEFEVLEGRIRSGDLNPRILPFFRSLMQHEKRVSFVFAGTHRLDELTRDYWGVLFNLAVYLEVGHLPEEASKELFVEPTRSFFAIDPLALDKTYHLTAGHPHFSQLLARELVDFRNDRHLTYITIQDLNEVAERVAEKGQLHFSYLWEDGTHAERLLLVALKELLDRKGIATLSAAHQFLIQRHQEIADPTVALRQLKRREIVTESAGLLSFRMELLRLWLDRHQNLESFLISEEPGWDEPRHGE